MRYQNKIGSLRRGIKIFLILLQVGLFRQITIKQLFWLNESNKETETTSE